MGRPTAIAWAVATLALTGAGRVNGEPMVAEVRLNGQPSGVVQFDLRGADLALGREQVKALRLVPPPAASQAEVVLGELPGVAYRIDQATQVVDITAEPSAITVTALTARGRAYQAPDRPPWGAALNYAVYGMKAQDGPLDVSALAEARVFGPAGVLTQSVAAQHAERSRRHGVRRLETSYARDDYERGRRLVAGDFISAGLPWAHPVRAGGIRYSSDLTLRPDLASQPLPQIRGAAATPSSVDLYVDGVRRLGARAPPGPFIVDTPPVVDGRGRVDLVVTDALGRQTVQSLPFYASSDLLRPGRSDFSVEAGALREDFASETDRYTHGFAAATIRRGISNAVTLEGRVAGSRDLQTAGAGMTAKLAEEALFSVAFAGSTGRGSQGGQAYLSARRETGLYSLYLALMRRSDDFRDLDWRPGDGRVTQSAQVGGSLRTDGWGSLSASYSRLTTGRGDLGVATVSWSRGVGPISLYASAIASDGGGGRRFSLGFNTPLGASRSASVAAIGGAHGTRVAATVASPPPLPTGWGWRMAAQTAGGDPQGGRMEGEARRVTRLGEFGAVLSSNAGRGAGQAYGSGSLVWFGGRPMAAANLGEAFAVVDTGSPGVDVTVENRPAGRTDRRGRVLIPQLPARTPSRIALLPESVGLDRDLLVPVALVSPPRGAGLLVSMPVVLARAATARIVDARGQPLRIGLPVRVNGRESGLIGFDGLAYLKGLSTINIIEIIDETGSCRLEARYGDIERSASTAEALACRLAPPGDLFRPPDRVAGLGPGG